MDKMTMYKKREEFLNSIKEDGTYIVRYGINGEDEVEEWKVDNIKREFTIVNSNYGFSAPPCSFDNIDEDIIATYYDINRKYNNGNLY